MTTRVHYDLRSDTWLISKHESWRQLSAQLDPQNADHQRVIAIVQRTKQDTFSNAVFDRLFPDNRSDNKYQLDGEPVIS